MPGRRRSGDDAPEQDLQRVAHQRDLRRQHGEAGDRRQQDEQRQARDGVHDPGQRVERLEREAEAERDSSREAKTARAHAHRDERELEMLHERGADLVKMIADVRPPDERLRDQTGDQRSCRQPLADATDVEQAEIAVVVVDDDHDLRGRADQRVERVPQRVGRLHRDREPRRLDLADPFVTVELRRGDPTTRTAVDRAPRPSRCLRASSPRARSRSSRSRRRSGPAAARPPRPGSTPGASARGRRRGTRARTHSPDARARRPAVRTARARRRR